MKLLDPTNEQQPAQRARAERPSSLDNLTIGLLDISKGRGDKFLDGVADELSGRGLTHKRYIKPTYSRPLPEAMLQQITQECDVVIEALAD